MTDGLIASSILRAPSRGRREAAAAVAFVALAAFAWWLVAGLDAPALRAAPAQLGDIPDDDGDGLHNALELRLGLSPDMVDTDGDGFSDPEEIARGSLGTDAASLPGIDSLGVGLEAYQTTGGPLQLVSVLYVADGDLDSKELGMGARVGSTVRKAPLSFFTRTARIITQVGKKSGSSLVIVDAPVDPLLVERFDSLSFFTTLGVGGSVQAAGVVNVAHKDGLLLEYVVDLLPGPTAPAGRAPVSGQGRYEPLNPIEVTKEWIPGQICAQTVVVAATLGPVVIQEVIDAECESGWDAYCDPDCPLTIGSTIQTLDPGSLIGG